MHPINRAAVVVRPKKPFLNWIQSMEEVPTRITDLWTSVYLTPADMDAMPAQVLRNCFTQIFEEQLEAWCNSEKDWPPKRDFSTFQKWLEAEVVDLVFDLSEQPIKHQE